jgi:hypothetical protein
MPNARKTIVAYAPESLDYFGGVPISKEYTQIDVKHEYDKEPLLMTEALVSGGTSTYNTNEKVVDMAVTTTIGSKVTRQTKRNLIYQPGKAFKTEHTWTPITTANLGVASRVGLFNDANGYYLEYFNGWRVVKRSSVTGSVVNTSVEQASWSGADKLDGTGASGITLDPIKSPILVIEGQFLGVGEVAMSLVFGKRKITIHEFSHSNVVSTKYMQTANLPLRYELEQMTGASAATMKCICLSGKSSGGFEPIGQVWSVNRGNTSRTVNDGVTTPILAVRASQAGVALNGINFGALTTSNAQLLIEFHLCSAVTGGTWATAGTNARSEVNLALTAFTSLREIDSLYAGSLARGGTSVLSSAVFTGRDIAGAEEILVVVVTPIGANSVCYAEMTYQELY